MNVNWQTIMHLGEVNQLTSLPGILAQTPVPSATTTTPSETVVSPMTQFLTAAGLSSLGPTVLNLVGAIVILIVGWLIATVVAGVVKNLLKRTDLDNRLVRSVMGPGAGTEPKVENIISSVVFWIIIITTVVAFLNALQLTTVAQPLNGFLNQIFAFLPKLGGAAVLVGIAWVLATLAKTVVTRAARSFSLDEKVATQTDTQQSPENQFLLSETLGNVLYWFIFLFFLPLILGVLDLQGPLQPVQNLLNDILAALPRILKAVMIGVVGWVVARVVRGIVTNLLTATGVDRIGAQFGLRRTAGSQSLSWLLGTVVYVLILIPTAIAALDALQIAAISGPATSMLNQILNAIPQIFTAAIILVIGYVVGRFVADLVRNLLAGIGFDNISSLIGLGAPPASPAPRVSSPPPTTQTTAPRVSVSSPPPTTQTTVPRREPTSPKATPLPTRTPSDIAGVVVLVGILLFAAIAATNVLNLPALTALMSGLLVVFGRVLVGLVIFAIGLYLANFSFNLISSSGYAQAQTLGQAARIAIIALVSAMALQQMGVAPDIVNLAFGLLLGSIAIAIAIAFGLGGRAVAGKKLQEWSESFDRNKPPSS